jgi:cell wall-associated NlpC family hydrolase
MTGAFLRQHTGVRRRVLPLLATTLALSACAGEDTTRQQQRTNVNETKPVQTKPPPRTETTITVAGVNEPGPTPKAPPPPKPEPKKPKVAPLPPPARDVSQEESVISPGAPSDAQVRRELRELGLAGGAKGPAGQAGLTSDGLAITPPGAPAIVDEVIRAANRVAHAPYVYGGGHGKWIDTGYDCSGSISFALGAAGLIGAPMASGPFMRWGAAGPGKWITVYANPGHAYMTVAGLRFDTSGRSGPRGSRWQPAMRTNAGFAVRHPPGL